MISMLLVGFVVGLLARAFLPGRDAMGWLMTTLLGILGSVIGAHVGAALGWHQPGEPAGWLMSILGAMMLLALLRRFGRPR